MTWKMRSAVNPSAFISSENGSLKVPMSTTSHVAGDTALSATVGVSNFGFPAVVAPIHVLNLIDVSPAAPAA
jgi:hypothetical protein